MTVSVSKLHSIAHAASDELRARVHFCAETGQIWLHERRMLLVHAEAQALLRKELLVSLGMDRARGLLTRMGYASGLRDAELARTRPVAPPAECVAIAQDRVREKAQCQKKTIASALKPADSATKNLKAALGDSATLWPEILSVEWTHRHYVADDEYIPYGQDIAAFLKREIAKPIIRWEDSPQLGYEILPNKYFYRYQPPTPAKDLLARFWELEKEAEKMLEGLAK